MIYKIQNIVLPEMEICEREKMYVKKDGEVYLSHDKIVMMKGSICKFSTYFNSFSLNKWKKYTNINNLTLRINLNGYFKIDIYSVYTFRNNIVMECIGSENVEICGEKDINIDISKNDNIFFVLTAFRDNSEFYSGYYYTNTDESFLNDVSINIVMCTFRREKFLLRNVKLIYEKLMLNQKKYNAAEHIKIKIIDNDGGNILRNLISDTQNIKLYPNINAGGSGGFCRGMMESLYAKDCTHILFMDDDVLIQIDALERTYNFLRLIKKEYNNSFIGGAMLRLDYKNVQLENLASCDFYNLRSLKESNIDLEKYYNVVYNEIIENKNNIYSAWWYTCIPVSEVNINTLPYPFFIRLDDVEFSLRFKNEKISLNGISVWHQPFDYKYSSSMECYYSIRNSLILMFLRFDIKFLKVIKYITKRFISNIFRYDYEGASSVIDAIEDVNRGTDFLKTVNTADDLKKHSLKNTKMKNISDIKDQEISYDNYRFENIAEESGIHKIFRFITLNGHLIPNLFFRNLGESEYGISPGKYTNARNYFLNKRVIVYDPSFKKCAIKEIDRKKMFKLIYVFCIDVCRFMKNFKKIKNDFTNEFSYMTSENFWRKYLKLN